MTISSAAICGATETFSYDAPTTESPTPFVTQPPTPLYTDAPTPSSYTPPPTYPREPSLSTMRAKAPPKVKAGDVVWYNAKFKNDAMAEGDLMFTMPIPVRYSSRVCKS